MEEHPYCLAMILCDFVYRDSATNKVTILGAFNQVQYRGDSDGGKARFCVYTSLTDGHGELELNVKIRHAEADFSDDDENVIATPEQGVPVTFADPLMVVEAVFVLNCEFTKPGVYYCELYAGGERIMFRRLQVAKVGGN